VNTAAALRIGADGSWMRWPSGGLSRYLDGLLHAITDVRAEDEFVIYFNSATGPELFAGKAAERFIRTPNRTLWNQIRLPLALRKDGCDVYLATAIVAPALSVIPCIPVIHDCTVFRDPDAKPGREGRYWRRWTRAAVRRAPSVITVSDFVKGDCESILDVDASRITVIHPGVATRFTSVSDPERAALRAKLSARYGFQETFLLHVGSYDRHKGAGVVVGAARRLAARGRSIGLVRCGPNTPDGINDAVVTNLGRVDDATLIDLYRAAAAVCVSSAQEGFGLPVLEAMACGSPVITTRTGGIPEAGGAVAVYAESNDPDAFATTLEAVLDSSPDVEQARRAEGIRWAGTFTWERAARATLDVVRDVARAAHTGE